MAHMTEDEYFRLTGKRLSKPKSTQDALISGAIHMTKGNKYGAKKKEVDGVVFDSTKESDRYSDLKILEKAGKIFDLQLQPKFELQSEFIRADTGEKIRALHYVADFSYLKKGDSQVTIEDVKGKKTPVYEIKKKLFLKRFSDKYLFIET